MLGRHTSRMSLSVRRGISSGLPLRLHTTPSSLWQQKTAPLMGRTLASAAASPALSTENSTNTPSAVLHRTLKSAPRQVVAGDGHYLIFSDGHKMLDSTCGAAVACIGYNNQRVKKAMVDQIDKFAYANSMFFGHPVGEALAAELVNSTGGVMSKAYVMCSGELSYYPSWLYVPLTSALSARLRGNGHSYQNGSPILYGIEPQAE